MRKKPGKMDLPIDQVTSNWLRFIVQHGELARHWHHGLPRVLSGTVGALSVVQEQAGEILELMGRSTQAKASLTRQALEATQDSNMLASQAKWVAFWASALGLAQSNTVSLVQIQVRAIHSWVRLMGSYTFSPRG